MRGGIDVWHRGVTVQGFAESNRVMCGEREWGDYSYE